ncbi:endonuclease/exonuclease/phosphatase family protein [Mycolicibacterium farcinogenes]|nr:endonuclease/exonuclease/phosphatase family protein [Mycolicibacterium farcinogenes]
MTRTVRLANWNVHWLNDNPEAREPLIVAELRRIGADVVTLQETWTATVDGSERSQAHRLAEALGYPYVSYVPVRVRRDRSQGQAVLSRYPILDTRAIEVPDETMIRRGCLTHIDIATGRIPVASIGLWGSAKIAWRQPVLIDRLEPYRRLLQTLQNLPAGLPPLVGADLNAHPDSRELRWLQGLDADTVECRELYLQDAWALARPSDPGYTVDPLTNQLVRVRGGRWRSDFILVGVGPKDRYDFDWEVVDCGRLGTPSASDHYGLWADLTLRPSQPTMAVEEWRDADADELFRWATCGHANELLMDDTFQSSTQE